MNITTEQTKKLLTGNHTFSQLGFSMLVTRLKKAYSDDSSANSLQKCTNEINTFFQKYPALAVKEFEIISKL